MFARLIAKTQPIAGKGSALPVVGRPPSPPGLDAGRRGPAPGSSRNLASLPIHAARAPSAIQRKLAVGRTDDPLEHEADRVADQVMRAPAPAVRRESERADDEEKTLRASPVSRIAAPLTLPAITLSRAPAATTIQRAWSDAATSGAKSNVGPAAPAGGWNQGETSVAGVRRIPVENIGGGNTAKDPQPSAVESADNRAIAILPATLDPTQPVDVLLHLHGHNVGYRQQIKDDPVNPAIKNGTVRDIDSDRIEQQIATSQRAIVGVLPQGTGMSAFGKLSSDAYIAEVFKALTALGAWGDGNAAPAVGRVIMSGHSGAGGRISEMMAEPGTPRLSSKLAEIALFDSINGPGELGIVTKWVTDHLDADLAGLNALGTTSGGDLNDAQNAYLRTSMRFVAYYSNGFYRPIHETLQKSIDVWFKAHALSGPGNPLGDALRANYRTVPVGHGNHNEVVGKGGHLTDAILNVPAPTPVTQSVQPKSDPYGQPGAAAPALVETTLRATGAPLDAATHGFMEQRFGHDFSRVRIHADSSAAQSASAISASAYTLGDQIVFGSGAYAPHSDAGRRLLAHELTHVVQQGHAAPHGTAGATLRRLPAEQNLTPVRSDEAGKKLPTYDVGDCEVAVPTSIRSFINAGTPVPQLNVNVFFSPGKVQGNVGNEVLTHGLRGAEGAGDWVLIAAPAARKLRRSMPR